jgi:quercetin dioxygenase-like cupin family protein
MKQNSSLFDPAASGIISLAANTQFSPQGIVSRALVTTPGMRVTLFGFAEGQELTEHASSSRAIIQVLSGRSEWTIAGEPRVVSAGEVLHMPPGTRHAVRAAEPFSMLLTLVKEGDAPRHE